MGTPELDSRMSGLQAFLESNPTSENEASDTQKEARWMLDTLQQYSTLGTKFKTLYAYESLNSPSQVRHTPLCFTILLYLLTPGLETDHSVHVATAHSIHIDP